MSALGSASLAAIAVAALTTLARLAALRPGTARLVPLADWALLVAAALVLAAAAVPQAWTVAVLGAAPLADPRLGGSIALAIAAVVGVFSLAPALGASGMCVISVVTAGAVGAAIAAAAVAFLGLRGGAPVTAVALGGAGFVPALVAVARLLRSDGRWRQALLAAGIALVAIGTALACCGARAGSVAVVRGAVVDTLGYALAYGGEHETAAGRRAIDLVVVSGRWRLEGHPTIAPTEAEVAVHEPFGKLLRGPVVILEGLERGTPGQHPVVWLAKGESVSAGDASLRFIKFRIEAGEPVHMYADLAVTRAGVSTTVSPVVHASSRGEEPVPVVVDGVGTILVAGIDADHGRVALLIPSAGERSAVTGARVTLALRPGLELAWMGLALGLVALIRGPRKETA